MVGPKALPFKIQYPVPQSETRGDVPEEFSGEFPQCGEIRDL